MTSATRTIVDTASAGMSPEHVEVAVAQALGRGMTTIRRLRAAASAKSERVQQMIEQAIDMATS